METNKFYAVLTGDVVGSSMLDMGQRNRLLLLIKSSFNQVNETLKSNIVYSPLEIFRGDSFQGVLSKPEYAFLTSLIIRANICSEFKLNRHKAIDARIAIGIGTIDFFPSEKGGEGDGEAYRNSGPLLDKMKKNQRLTIKTPWEKINNEFNTAFALFDAIIFKWTGKQAEAISLKFSGLNQEQIANRLNIKQSSINERLENAGSEAIYSLEQQFNEKIIYRAATL
ncbi:MAG: SatD family protein [Bacteroidales bacterium]|nr:SatD family protein [Bacteroidales bacterium]